MNPTHALRSQQPWQPWVCASCWAPESKSSSARTITAPPSTWIRAIGVDGRYARACPSKYLELARTYARHCLYVQCSMQAATCVVGDPCSAHAHLRTCTFKRTSTLTHTKTYVGTHVQARTYALTFTHPPSRPCSERRRYSDTYANKMHDTYTNKVHDT
jgi:hypothetical protein